MNGSVTEFWKRREWLGLHLGAAVGWGLAPGLISCAGRGGRPRNVIFLVADGMSQGVPTLAESFSGWVRGRGTRLADMLRRRDVEQGFFDTASMDSLVTDSAAAASAWSSGRRVPNRRLNTYPDGTALTPLCRVLREHGRRCGLVTTARITHATPAGFAAVSPHRDFEDEIAGQYLEAGVDVLLGGGLGYFTPEGRPDHQDLRPEFERKGFKILSTRQELIGHPAGAGAVLGLFSLDHFPYTLDWKQDERDRERVPTLAEMTGAALRSLHGREGFFLMVEGARIDHAAHANDAAGILWEQLAFDDAIGVALDFQARNPETLVIVTSDHGNANPGLNGMGPSYTESTACFRRVSQARGTFAALRRAARFEINSGVRLSPAWMAQAVKEMSGYEPSRDEAGQLLAALEEKPVRELSVQQAGFYGLLGQILGNWQGVGWTGVTHTADWVMLAACGPGSAVFRGLLRNEEFFERLTDLWGIGFRNPVYAGPVEEAQPAERPVSDPTG